MAEGGHHTIGGRGPTLGRALVWRGPLVGLLRLPFGLRDLLVILLTMSFVSSNSENIYLIDFLKQKTTENRELALCHLVNRLVSENA